MNVLVKCFHRIYGTHVAVTGVGKASPLALSSWWRATAGSLALLSLSLLAVGLPGACLRELGLLSLDLPHGGLHEVGRHRRDAAGQLLRRLGHWRNSRGPASRWWRVGGRSFFLTLFFAGSETHVLGRKDDGGRGLGRGRPGGSGAGGDHGDLGGAGLGHRWHEFVQVALLAPAL